MRTEDKTSLYRIPDIDNIVDTDCAVFADPSQSIHVNMAQNEVQITNTVILSLFIHVDHIIRAVKILSVAVWAGGGVRLDAVCSHRLHALDIGELVITGHRAVHRAQHLLSGCSPYGRVSAACAGASEQVPAAGLHLHPPGGQTGADSGTTPPPPLQATSEASIHPMTDRVCVWMLQVPSVGKLVDTAAHCFSKEDVVAMEQAVLLQLGGVVRPTRQLFLNRFLLAAKADLAQLTGGDLRPAYKRSDDSWTKEDSFAQMMLDITLQNYSFNQFRMSLVAAAVVHLTHQVPAQTTPYHIAPCHTTPHHCNWLFGH